jgi:hypothetical protein
VQSTSLAMPLHNVGMLDPTWMSYFCAKAWHTCPRILLYIQWTSKSEY